MKLTKVFLSLVFILSVIFSLSAQQPTLVGRWQLVKQSNCLTETTSLQDSQLNDLQQQMQGQSGPTAQIVRFKENSSGDESTRILDQNKSGNAKKFFYKFNGKMLLILNKKSQTISDSYLVDKFSSDSLIVSNSARPCETKVFVKISEDQAN